MGRGWGRRGGGEGDEHATSVVGAAGQHRRPFPMCKYVPLRSLQPAAAAAAAAPDLTQCGHRYELGCHSALHRGHDHSRGQHRRAGRPKPRSRSECSIHVWHSFRSPKAFTGSPAPLCLAGSPARPACVGIVVGVVGTMERKGKRTRKQRHRARGHDGTVRASTGTAREPGGGGASAPARRRADVCCLYISTTTTPTNNTMAARGGEDRGRGGRVQLAASCVGA